MKFFIRIELVDGARQITGCADNRDNAERLFGFGNYSAIYADDCHSVAMAARDAGFLDEPTCRINQIF